MTARNRDSPSPSLNSMTPSTTMTIYKISKLAKNLWLDKGTRVVEERSMSMSMNMNMNMSRIKSQTLKMLRNKRIKRKSKKINNLDWM